MNGSNQTSTSKSEPWEPLQQPILDYITQAQQLAAKGKNPYEGQRVADLNPMFGGGLQMLTDYAMQGTPERAAGGAAVLNATQGNMNPYAQQMNPYMGENPYLQSMIGHSNDELTKAFAKGPAAQNDSAAAMSGAFGGSAYNERVQDNNKTLGGLISNNTNSLLKGQYDQSAGLAENALNRATGGYDNAQNRALTGASIGQGQQGLDLQAIMAMINGGQQGMGYQQNLLDAGRNIYDERQNMPFDMSQFLGGALGRGMTGFGQQTTQGPGQSPLSQFGGLGLLASSLFF